MKYDYDLFISYAHIDDRSPFGQEKGWIDLLHERLSVLLAQALGYDLNIWRDGHSLQGNDELGGAIGDGVTRALLLVPIISPRYVQSDWCRREIETFHAGEPPPVAAAPGFRSRVFKVVKTPLPAHLKMQEPEHIRNLIGYEFYGKDDASGALCEFSPDPADKQYWKMLNRLVGDITRTIIELKHSPEARQAGEASAHPPTHAPSSSAPSAATPATVSPAPTTAAAAVAAATVTTNGAGVSPPSKLVYLAETTSDLTNERELVRDELRQRGYGVLPEQKLPLESKDMLTGAVRADLARCALSVHLVGARYGSTPEDDANSVVCIQESLAAERGANDAAFQRLLWMPPGLMSPAMEVSDERQKAFVTQLQNRVAAGAELLQMSVEDLKTRVVEKLAPPAKAHARADRRSKLKQVYLICEKRDRPLVRPIREYLFKHNFEVITLRAEEDAGEKLADYHRKNLKECDAALIYFGNADEPWVRKNLEDLEKAYGYGREDDWCASAVYVGSPPNDEKEDFLTHMAPVIRNFSGFNPDDLREFVTAVESAEEGGQR